MQSVTSADGTPIAYEQTGSGPPFVLVHGTAADHTAWSAVRARFAARVTVYTMDRRGRGKSGDASAYALEREFEDVAAVVESADRSAAVLGHSFGGLCALGAAIQTDRIEKLILYEPPLPRESARQRFEAVYTEMADLVADGEDERALVRFFETFANLDAPEIEMLQASPNWPDRVAMIETVLREIPAPLVYEFDADRFARLQTPTLLLTGSESSQFLSRGTEILSKILPNSRVVTFDGHGHAAMSTAPDRFVEAVTSFVDPSS